MKISATSSGGFAGLAEHHEIDTLTHPQGPAIEAALYDAGFFTGQQPADTPAGADMVQWSITVESPHTRRSIRFAEDGSAASTPWQALIVRLRQAA